MAGAIITKDAPIDRKSSQKASNIKVHMLLPTKGICTTYKKQAFRQHAVDNQKSYTAILRQTTAHPQPQDKTFTFSAEELVKFVVNVAIPIAHPQVFYTNSTQDAIDKKSSMCRRVSEATKTHFNVDISGNSLFDAIGHLRPPAPSAPPPKPKTLRTKSEAPFKFTLSTKVIKPSAILKTFSPTNKPSKIVLKQSKTSQ